MPEYLQKELFILMTLYIMVIKQLNDIKNIYTDVPYLSHTTNGGLIHVYIVEKNLTVGTDLTEILSKIVKWVFLMR